VTRTLVPEAELARVWRGRQRLATLLTRAAAPDLHLLEEAVTLTEEGEVGLVSLGSDAAAAALVQQEKLEQRKKPAKLLSDALWICIPLMFLFGAVGFYFGTWRQSDARAEYEQGLEKVKEFVRQVQTQIQAGEGNRWPMYIGQMHQAQVAWQTGDILGLRQLLLAQKQAPGPDQRGFEWRYLWRRLQGAERTLQGHSAEVGAVAISPDESLLASGGSDGAVKVWHLPGGQPLYSFNEMGGAVHTVAFAPDGNRLAAAGDGKAIHIYKVDIAGPDKVVRVQSESTLPVTAGAIRALTFTDKTTLLAAGDNGINLWNLVEKKVLKSFVGHEGPVLALALAPDGSSFASGGVDHKINLWDLKKKEGPDVLGVHAGPVRALAYTRDGKTLATGSARRQDQFELGELYVWDLPKRTKVEAITNAAIHALAFAPDGTTLYSAARNNVVEARFLESHHLSAVLKGHLGWVQALAVDAKGTGLATASRDGTIKLWNLPRPPDAIAPTGHWICSTALAPGDQQVAAGSRSGAIYLFEVATGKQLKVLDGHKGPVIALAFHQSEERVLLTSGSLKQDKEPGQLLLFDVNSGEVVKRFTVKDQEISALALAPNGKLLAAADQTQVTVWNLADPAKADIKYTFTPGHGSPHCLAISGDGTLLAAGGDDGVLRLWDLTTGKLLNPAADGASSQPGSTPLHRHLGPIRALAFAPRGTLLASASDDSTIKLWDARDRVEIATFRGHVGEVLALAFDADGKTLASGGRDHTVKLWDVAPQRRGLVRFTFVEHAGPVRSVAFSGDNRLLVSAGHDGVIQLRRAAPPEKMEEHPPAEQ
jgi:WD40 repeat protein